MTPVRRGRWEVFTAFLLLGLVSFGGPVAHLGYFRREFVERRGWLSEEEYAGMVGLCQTLPGPASSQLGFCLGLRRAGLAGGICAFLGFTLPSALLMSGLGLALDRVAVGWAGPVVHGLKLVAVAVVAHGVVTMARRLCPDPVRAGLAVGVMAGALMGRSGWMQPLLIGAAGVMGWLACPASGVGRLDTAWLGYGRRVGALCLVAAVSWIGLLEAGARLWGGPLLSVVAGCSRAGGLVFGGGHVVLPLLERAVVGPGWVTREAFLAGYGAAQAMPGPLFTLASFLGAQAGPGWMGMAGAALAGVAIFLPGLLVVAGALPFWQTWGGSRGAGRVLAGVNAGVVGLLAAAFHEPVWTTAIRGGWDMVASGVALGLLVWGRVPVLLVVVLCVGTGLAQR